MDKERYQTNPGVPGQLKMASAVHALTADALRQYGGQPYPSHLFYDTSTHPTPTHVGVRSTDGSLFQVPCRSPNYYEALPPIQRATTHERSGVNTLEPIRGSNKASALLRKFEVDNSVLRWDQV